MSPPIQPDTEQDDWDDYEADGGDLCSHGYGFDEYCEDCEEESAEEEPK